MVSSSLIIPLAGLALTFIALLILTPKMLKQQKQASTQKHLIEFPCPTCQSTIFITRNSMLPITGAQAALIIQKIPDAPQHHLAEQRCQACSSTNTFRIDHWPPTFLIANAIQAQKISNKCVECRDLLIRPTWTRGIYDQKIAEIPDLNPKIGLKCPRCHAVSCVACLETVTRNRTPDGSYLCPRCYRHPVNLVHHF